MLVTLLGILTERSGHLWNAESPILDISLGITVFTHPANKALLSLSIIALQLLRLSYFVLSGATLIEDSWGQPQKALFLMQVTLLGIVIDLSLLQSEKAS
jgi:uncharacterized membrane protein HdeD (DUF308 family)